MSSSPIIDPSKMQFCRLSNSVKCNNFDCGNEDLNDFIQTDALQHQKQNIAQTTCILYEDKIIGYFTLSCDALRGLTNSEKRRILKTRKKNYKEYPAIKIARMALISEYQRQGLGTIVLDTIKGFVFTLNEKGVACRFITVDAYSDKVGFYLHNGFKHNTGKESKSNHTISMRLDPFA